MKAIRVGISGWDHGGWKGGFYPADPPAKRRLPHAARAVGTIEINATFHRLATPTLFRRRRLATPEGFHFAVERSRHITHHKRLGGAGIALADFFASGILELEETLGPIPWQLPDLRLDALSVEGFGHRPASWRGTGLLPLL